jgi:enterochelin esterase-like enzyme
VTDAPGAQPYVRQPVETDPPVRYAHGPASARRTGVPVGRAEAFTWADSSVYPGTSRTVRVHVPAQYSASRPAALMVFQDGELYLDPDLDIRAGIVLDNLIHAGEMPVTVGVFVDPGSPGNRNAEYDPADDRYADFLLTEIIPAVRELVNLVEDPELWGIGGGSSGGNCAFTVGWQRPDRFRRILSFVGSFAQIPGGNPYPDRIRREERKPLRIYQQADLRDLNADQPEDNWLSHNLLVAAALAERGYDHRLVLGEGGHSTLHGGVILPDALRWLWRPGTRR